MRRRNQLTLAAVFLAGATGATLVFRSHNALLPTPPHSIAKHPANLGPVPLALSDEPSPPARLTGTIEPLTTSDDNGDDPVGESAVSSVRPPDVRPFEPRPASEMGWRSSARTAEDSHDQATGNKLLVTGFPKNPSGASFPGRLSKVTAWEGRPSDADEPGPQQQTKVVLHRIVDGDTLPSLAQRYLGSANRFNEIFFANRDRLPRADLLPIGMELRITVSP